MHKTKGNLLPDSCLKHIFEYLEDDMYSLNSCLLVNRTWCMWAVGILWRDTGRYLDPLTDLKPGAKLFSILLRSLIAQVGGILPDDDDNHTIFLKDIYCLPPPIFNYPSFFRVLSAFHLNWIIDCGLKFKKDDDDEEEEDVISTKTLPRFIHSIKYNFYQMLMKVCPSIRKLDLTKIDIPFPYFLGAKECFSQIYELHCDDTASAHLYYQLALMCSSKLFIDEYDDENAGLKYNNIICNFENSAGSNGGGFIIRRLVIEELKNDNQGLAYLISIQKYLECVVYGSDYDINLDEEDHEPHEEIGKALVKVSRSIKHFTLSGQSLRLPLETIGHFSNLAALEISVDDDIDDLFRSMTTSATFKGLRILRIGSELPSLRVLSKFLTKYCTKIEILDLYGFWPNGRKKLTQLNKTIVRSCSQNLYYLATSILDTDHEIIKQILISCKQLVGLYLISHEKKINSQKLFRVLADHYPVNFSKLCLFNRWGICRTSLETLLDRLLVFKKRIYLCTMKQDEFNFNNIQISQELLDVIEDYKNIGILRFEQIESYQHWKLIQQ